MLVSAIDYNDYVGRIAIGRIERGTIGQGQEMVVCDWRDREAQPSRFKVVSLYEFEGLERLTVPESSAGSIAALSGIEGIEIGNTICAVDAPEPLPFMHISEPTLEMTFSVNDSPFAGQDGKYVTSRNLRDRLMRELLGPRFAGYRLEQTDSYNVAGRGEMHLAILIETMRREGMSFRYRPRGALTRILTESAANLWRGWSRTCRRGASERSSRKWAPAGGAHFYQQRREPYEARIQDPVAGAVRLQERLPYGYARQRGHELGF